jgi:hypothetical protein
LNDPAPFGSSPVAQARLVGQGIDRVEDARLLRGAGAFADDLHLPGMLHAVVLRSADASSGELVCYTDRRSPKASQLRVDGRGVLVFWCARLSWQLRAQVRIEIEDEGPRVQAAWARVAGQPGARDYLAPTAPGTAVSQPGIQDGPHDMHHLAVLAARVEALDWLELDRREGPRRAAVDAQGRAQWLMP